MINRQSLLSDLQAVLKRLEADLLERSESADIPDVGETLRGEYERAKKAERTAQNYEDWRSDAVTQAAAAWVLSCVFVRFLEDNKLIDPPKMAGPKERLQQARDEHTLYFQDSERAKLTDREYLLSVFDELAKLPGTKDVFGEHNPIRELPNWLSGDAAGELLRFFQKVAANTGDLIHDFTDLEWDTRFLGDLYQDLSEAARKKYALLQTPEFVEEFILDQTLDPALDEFGLDTPPVIDKQGKPITDSGFRIIDPACGSGHFLLGAFPRILDRWQKQEPGGKIRDLVQKTLDCIYGVDVNPYAVAIARFRLLLMAMKACGIKRLTDAPAFHFNLTCGDSLLHAPLRGGQQVFDWELSSEDAECEHAYQSEDLAELKRTLRSGIYHAVVANPPYITVKDNQLNHRYRKRFESCHRQYSLAVPFMERIFRMAVDAGFTGQITANSFMKREFGKKLVEGFLPSIDLTHIIDTAAVQLAGHSTPTVIVIGRHRKPIIERVLVSSGLKGSPANLSNDYADPVWKSLTEHFTNPGYEDEFVSVLEVERERLSRHPWTLSGGIATELVQYLDEYAISTLDALTEDTGAIALTRDDDSFVLPLSTARRVGFPCAEVRPYVAGEHIRDWTIYAETYVLWPYDESKHVADASTTMKHWLWKARTQLQLRSAFGKTQLEHGKEWFEYSMLFWPRYSRLPKLAYANVSTHNHFVSVTEPMVLNAHAPVVILREATVDVEGVIESILNSSLACFWMKQVCQPKGTATGDISTEKYRPEANRFEFTSTALSKFPLPKLSGPIAEQIMSFREAICECTESIKRLTPMNVIKQWSKRHDDSLKSSLDLASLKTAKIQRRLVALQEEIDWLVYRLYGLTDEAQVFFPEIPLQDLDKNERPFLWQSGASKSLSSSTLEVFTKRHDMIARNRWIQVLEAPVHKRLWQGRQGVYGSAKSTFEESIAEAERVWLLDRLESYFDFDGRMNDESQPTVQIGIGLTTVAKLTDVARQDSQFMEVGEVYRDDSAFDVQQLVEELVQGENVPLLPILRYKPAGLRKRKEWEKTWELQRQEDVIDARTQLPEDDPQYLTEDRARNLKQHDIGDIPVPPKYKSGDFISTGGARYWALRGKLDVPKERWVSFPHCEGPDGTLVIAWAGYDHLQLVRAISAYFVDIQERLGGRDDPRLVPLLACIIELLPWLKQWHHDIDPDYNQRMDEVFEGFVAEEAKYLGMTFEEIKAWQPPKKTNSRKKRRSGT